MTRTEQRIAIAVFCGWNPNPETEDSNLGWGANVAKPHWRYPHQLLDYCSDLNAVRDAESVFTYTQCHDYESALREVLIQDFNTKPRGQAEAYDLIWHATAAQRAEALLKTIGKWKEENE